MKSHLNIGLLNSNKRPKNFMDKFLIKFLLKKEDINVDKGQLSYGIEGNQIIVNTAEDKITVYLDKKYLIHNILISTKKVFNLIVELNLTYEATIVDSDIVLNFKKHIIRALVNSNYSFKITNKAENLNNINFNIEFNSETERKELEEEIVIVSNLDLVRDVINTPPNIFTPDSMVGEIRKHFSNDDRFEFTTIKDSELLKENMALMYSVGKASDNRPILIHLIYKPSDNSKGKVVLVGKGLTYDSGGLSLKPGSSLISMKADKSGAATVLGIMKNAKDLNPNIEIHGIFAMAENMIDSNSFRPDDVIFGKNGVSVEILNTDAEGRLVLADALAYAQEKIPDIDYIIDFATLTGAAVVGLGEFTFAVMGENEQLKQIIQTRASIENEHSTILHFNQMLEKTIKSDIADVANLSSTRYGGALTAGLFLNRFIDENYKDKWIHLDIAGPAYVSTEWEDKPKGASGVAVTTITKWILNMSEKKVLKKEFSKQHSSLKK